MNGEVKIDQRIAEQDRNRLLRLAKRGPMWVAKHPDEWGVAAPTLRVLRLRLRGETRPTRIYRLWPDGSLNPEFPRVRGAVVG